MASLNGLWSAALILLISACGARPDEGSAAVGVVTAALSAADVKRVTVTITAADIAAPIVNDLALVNGQWKGVIGKIPAGADRTFKADAFDAQNTLLYTGGVTGVTIAPGPPVLVYILLQQKDPPDPFQNSVPLIDSLVASAIAVAPGATVSLEVTAHDPDPGDTLTYSWTAGSGSFDDTASTTPVWTAPASEGPITLTVTVTDANASAQSLSVVIDVALSHANGPANIQASLNTWPVITGLVAAPAQVDASGTTSLSLTVTDADGDPLAYSWSDGGGECEGSFSSASAQSPSWTAPSTAPASGACTLNVTVADNRGGSTTGAITVQVGSAPSPNAAPVITNTFQSSANVDPGAGVLFKVTATDPESQALTFAWSAATGTLATSTNTATTSDVTWTAPAIATSYSHTVTVTVSDTAGGTMSQDFTVTTVPKKLFYPGATFSSAQLAPVNPPYVAALQLFETPQPGSINTTIQSNRSYPHYTDNYAGWLGYGVLPLLHRNIRRKHLDMYFNGVSAYDHFHEAVTNNFPGIAIDEVTLDGTQPIAPDIIEGLEALRKVRAEKEDLFVYVWGGCTNYNCNPSFEAYHDAFNLFAVEIYVKSDDNYNRSKFGKYAPWISAWGLEEKTIVGLAGCYGTAWDQWPPESLLRWEIQEARNKFPKAPGIAFWISSSLYSQFPQHRAMYEGLILEAFEDPAPLVVFANVSEGQTLTGTVAVQAQGTANASTLQPITAYRFFVDNKCVQTGASPSLTLDTSTLSTGPHTLTVHAVDADYLAGVAQVSVEVDLTP